MNSRVNTTVKQELSHAIQAMRTNNFNEAVKITQKLVAEEPKNARALAVQFSSLFKAKRFEEARQIGGTAAKLNPKSMFILNNQACLQLEAKQPAAAVGLLKSLIDQFGERSQWLYNMALAQRMVGNYDYSIATFRRTLDHQPDHDRAAFQLAECLNLVGQKEDALRTLNYVRLLRNKHAQSHSNYIHFAAASHNLSAHALKQEFRLWAERFVPHNNQYPSTKIENSETVRIGFTLGVVPSDWLERSIAPLINQLTNGNDSVLVYWHDEKLRNDVFSKQVQVIHSPGFSDASFARRVRADNIDILVDICGMRRGSRQRTLGMRVASKEYGWLAHEGFYATPLVTLLDEKLGQQRFFVSKGLQAKTTPLPTKTLAAIGCKSGLSNEVIKVWAEILRELPTWSIHFDSKSMLVNKALTQRFQALGIAQERLSFDTKKTISFGTIVLDNFVENDPVAAGNAIGNGGVLVTLEGELFPARQNSALLEQIGCSEWIAANQADYINRVLALAEGLAIEPVSEKDFINSGIRDLVGFTQRFRAALLDQD